MSKVADALHRPSVLIETPAKNNYIFQYPWNLVSGKNATHVSLKRTVS